MKICIANTYEMLSAQAASDAAEIMNTVANPLICVASGDSPVGLYKELVQKNKAQNLDFTNWLFVGLDEWLGMNKTDEGSCQYYVEQQLFQPLQVPQEHVCFFDGRASDPENECRETEAFIQQHSGIDVAIIGLGLNGHIGMNEPHTPASTRTHIADIDPLTAQTGQKYFKEQRTLSQGITLGLATLFESKNIFLIVSGSRKAAIVKQVLEGEISEAVPASLLRNHPSCTIYLDADAAHLLQTK
ncbi:MAG: glucosamine-6-phosphate deaminase [Panacibacter sp.]